MKVKRTGTVIKGICKAKKKLELFFTLGLVLNLPAWLQAAWNERSVGLERALSPSFVTKSS